MTVRRPRLLGAGFAEKNRLEPSDFSLSLPLRDVPSASMTLPGYADILTHQWMELFTARGSAGLFRVTDIEHNTGGETSLTLRHGIDTLSDDLWPSARTDYSGTVAGFLGELMSRQTVAHWQLGTCEDSASYKKSGINYNKLSDLFAGLISDRNDYYPEYDFSTTPWTINWRALPSSVSAEFRLSRNVESATVSRSDADMCNRLYLAVNTGSVENGVNVNTASYVTYNDTASQAIYGVIARFEDIDTEGVASISDWVSAYFAKRSAPAVQITIDGLELAALTGDTWDEYDRGRMVRAILTDMGETINERVECVTYPDVLGEPERVEVELANRLETFTKSVAKVSTTAASANYESHAVGRSSARGSQLSGVAGQANRIELVVTDVKEAVDGTGITEMWQSGIVIDAQAGVTISSLYQGFSSQYAAINVNSAEISSLVAETGVNSLGQGETLYSRIVQNATSISTEVTDRTNADSALSSRITQNANSISLVVENGAIKPAAIVAAINGSASTVIISADHVNIDGWMQANLVTVDGLYSKNSITALKFITCGTYLNAGTDVQINGTSLKDAVISFGTPTESSGQISIPYTQASGATGNINFNIAATQYYQNGVAAAWNNAAGSIVWPSAGTGNAIGITYPVSGGSTTTKAYVLTQGSWSGTSKYVYLREDTAQGSAVARTEIDASSIYNAGVSQVTSNITLSTGSWNSSGQRTVAAKYNGTTYASDTISLPTITVSHTSWNANYQCTARAYASGIGYVDTDTIDASSVYSAGSSAGYSSGYSAGYSEGYADGQSSSSYSSSDLHISKSGGNVLLYLGNNVISRTCSIGVTSVSQSGPNSYRITVRIDGDTDFYLTY